MEILINISEGLIPPQLPDDSSKFINREVVTIEEGLYFHATYVGSKILDSDYSVDKYRESLQPILIPITIEAGSVSPIVEGFDDTPNSFTVKELVEISATGYCDIPNRVFRVPFKREDGRIVHMIATVSEGRFTLSLNFPTRGKWIVDKELVNSELEKPLFDSETYVFYVI